MNSHVTSVPLSPGPAIADSSVHGIIFVHTHCCCQSEGQLESTNFTCAYLGKGLGDKSQGVASADSVVVLSLYTTNFTFAYKYSTTDKSHLQVWVIKVRV